MIFLAFRPTRSLVLANPCSSSMPPKTHWFNDLILVQLRTSERPGGIEVLLWAGVDSPDEVIEVVVSVVVVVVLVSVVVVVVMVAVVVVWAW